MIYVVSDLHGYPMDKFLKLLKQADFSDDDYCPDALMVNGTAKCSTHTR